MLKCQVSVSARARVLRLPDLTLTSPVSLFTGDGESVRKKYYVFFGFPYWGLVSSFPSLLG